MMQRLTLFLISAVALILLTGLTPTDIVVAQEATEAVAEEPAGDEDDLSALLRALDLPVAAARARHAGVPEDKISGALEALRSAQVPAGVAADALELEQATAARARGDVAEQEGERIEEVEATHERFGEFVRESIREGLRGEELSAAIREERERRGLPASGHRAGRGEPGVGSAAGPSEGRGRTVGTSRPAPGERGARPDHAGPEGEEEGERGADAAEERRPDGAGPPASAGERRPDRAAPPEQRENPDNRVRDDGPNNIPGARPTDDARRDAPERRPTRAAPEGRPSRPR